MRVAVNMANAALVTRLGDGSLSGRLFELSQALARSLGVPADFVPYASGGAILADLGAGRWDLAFLAVDPARTDRLHFSRPIAKVEATFAVLDRSLLTSAAQADRTGQTIATARNAAYELYLKRTLTHATTVSHDTPAAALESVLLGRCDLAAGIRDALANAASAHPQLRVLTDAFLVVSQAIALERDRTAAAAFVDAFLEDAAAFCGPAKRG